MATKEPTETSPLILPTTVADAAAAAAVQRDLGGGGRGRGSLAWRVGIVLATLSGVLHTANNFFIQYFAVDALELLLVRSAVQALALGALAAATDPRLVPSTLATRLFVATQAVLGGVRLYMNFKCLGFMPLGDALTIIFTEPLFTIILSLIFLRTKYV